ncbi:NAD(P)H-dependent glycerol-3-phosphate dehydrogenase [Govanella unica]|uniref:Glycerol-3-phosphate dehydrogenase [NAD(P)+] n=1 Tax=Govanella unica TaxID=2975056 RepID=A0A9X3Z7Y4_9PROT|nr:NAD(P)H-dependent glycerol-3-phosphate dehydrogenase [Govania unica]MDA5194479.1 NAD(P)-dependent glycerol-3-phosphate dehydrogenase [Govania unica]
MAQTIGVVGGGAWGTALATVAARAGHEVILWVREPEVAEAINSRHENSLFLPGVILPDSIRASTDPQTLGAADILLLVAPAQHMRGVLTILAPHLKSGAPVVVCAKGIEESTGALMSEVTSEILPSHPLAVLSGPTFAAEVARGQPAAVTLASKYQTVIARITEALGQPTFRPYGSTDVVGAEIGGAVKNVIAIAAGIVDGCELGENARAAVITRGMAEILRFAQSRGAERETMLGLCGLGDMILTCGSPQSRNMSLGRDLGRGRSLADILGERKSVAEGVYTARVLANIARERGIDMPIVQAVAAILHEGQSVQDAIEDLLQRPFRPELQG